MSAAAGYGRDTNLRSSDQSLAAVWPLVEASMDLPPHVLAAISEVSRRWGLSAPDLLKPGCRNHRIDTARWLAMLAVAELPDPATGELPSSVQVGRWFRRHHTTVLHALGRLRRAR